MGSQNVGSRYSVSDEGFNGCPSIVKDIAHIGFIHMTELSIKMNHIASIEILPFIDMPHLE
jgi:hypothetical protein